MKIPKIFEELSTLFANYGYKLYMVGGSARDFLLRREVDDYDFATNATVEQMFSFVPNMKAPFAHLGAAIVKYDGQRIDITTLRKEEDYEDFRHPNKVTFVQNPEEDYRRRDFTINALYIDENGDVIDFVHGLNDLHFGIIRMIGNPYIRIMEDPLRILRALRFSLLLNFEIEEHLKKVIKENIALVDELNPQKVKIEIQKMKLIDEKETALLLKEYHLSKYY